MNHLMKAMLDKKALNSDTVITACHMVKDSTGRWLRRQDDFMMTSVSKHGDEYKLMLRQVIGNAAVCVWARDVVALDGMVPERYVDVYDINPDGSTKRVGKKRGRKPKAVEAAF